MDEISDSKKIDQIIVMIDKIVNNNGPSEHEYDMLNSMLTKIGELRAEGFLKNEDIIEFQKRFGEAMLTTKTLQGLGCVKPHGYPGDFEIIDKIYTCSITKDDKFKKWDYFFQAQPASIAVRNRKIYFKQLLKTKANNIRILNLASGPCRDMIEYFEENPKSEIIFDCVELDTNAIEFGQDLINKSSIGPTKINFINKNIFKFDTVNKYDLIWSAGLFDYFEDKVFIRILKRFLKNIKNGGEIVIGNFHPKNPSKSYMEFGFWYLNHRTEDDLIKLANSCGIQNKNIEIKSECAGVNLFLHIDNREY
jgi:SAM-dependent methyltransferase